MDDLKPLLDATGFSLPSPAYLVGMLFFSIVGIAAFRWGRKCGNTRVKWLGMGLMLYPYVVTSTLPMYTVGAALCAAIWYWR